MKRKSAAGIFVALLLLMGMLSLALNIQPTEASGTIYIRANGAVEPPTPLIWTDDNITYTFTGSITDSIVIQRSNIILDGQGFVLQSPTSGSGNGFYLSGVSNVTIKNTNVKNFLVGVYLLSSSSYNVVSGNNITGNSGYGVYVISSSNYNTVSGNNLTANNGYGIYLYSSSNNNSIYGNNVSANRNNGIQVSSSFNDVSGNNVTGNTGHGVYISGSSNTIVGNNITANTGTGVYILGFNHIISGNNITANNADGIFASSGPHTISENNITANGQSGISLGSASNAVLRNNTLANNKYNFKVTGTTLSHFIHDIDYFNKVDGKPIYYLVNKQDGTVPPDAGFVGLVNSTSMTIEGVDIENNGDGILLAYTTNSTITQNNITKNEFGVRLYYSSNNTIYRNRIFGSQITPKQSRGIYLSYSSYNVMYENNITANSLWGITLEYASSYNNISGNYIARHGWGPSWSGYPSGGISVASVASSNNVMSGNSIVLNNDGIRLEGGSSLNTISENTIITGRSHGVLLSSSSLNSMSDNNITSNRGHGFTLSSSTYNNMSGNIIANNGLGGTYSGISLASSSNYNSINGNRITENNAYGISMSGSNNNSVSGNSIIASTQDGIYLSYSSKYNTISENNVTTSNRYGIYLYSSSNNNSIFANNVTDNKQRGITLTSSSNNTIYHNNFINNTKQVSSTTSVNIWDDGYPSGGNHWSNYTGTDNYRGMYQNETGSDGVGDTYHIIDTSNTDHYPLMKPYGGLHDIGITSVQTSKTVVGEGYYCTISISVKIVNYGLSPETFDLNVYVNTAPLSSQTVTLTGRNSTTITFTWDTEGLAKGVYTISAYATPVLNETDTTDNLAAIIVKVSIPGDINGDWIVDGYDVHLIGKAYGSTPASLNWNANADINNSNLVDNADLAIVMENYGAIDP